MFSWWAISKHMKHPVQDGRAFLLKHHEHKQKCPKRTVALFIFVTVCCTLQYLYVARVHRKPGSYIKSARSDRWGVGPPVRYTHCISTIYIVCSIYPIYPYIHYLHYQKPPPTPQVAIYIHFKLYTMYTIYYTHYIYLAGSQLIFNPYTVCRSRDYGIHVCWPVRIRCNHPIFNPYHMDAKVQVAYVSKLSSSNFVGFYILSFALANLALRRSLTLTYSVASTATPESGGRSMLSKDFGCR